MMVTITFLGVELDLTLALECPKIVMSLWKYAPDFLPIFMFLLSYKYEMY